MKKIKLFSWNVNGLRAILKKGSFVDFLEREYPDIICLQEIKCKPSQIDLDSENEIFNDYDFFWNPAERAGYSGTAILINKKIKVNSVKTINKLNEGRIIYADLENFYLVNVYTPNSKPDLSRLELRKENWDPEFLKILKNLEEKKPVVTCGDFNAAHKEIDLARPKNNHHNAGFTNDERRGITNLLNAGFVDSFRLLNPESKRYTWWSHWGKARENNVGWRIDYFFLSKTLKKNLKSAEIYEKYLGSDHCPISIDLEF